MNHTIQSLLKKKKLWGKRETHQSCNLKLTKNIRIHQRKHWKKKKNGGIWKHDITSNSISRSFSINNIYNLIKQYYQYILLECTTILMHQVHVIPEKMTCRNKARKQLFYLSGSLVWNFNWSSNYVGAFFTFIEISAD